MLIVHGICTILSFFFFYHCNKTFRELPAKASVLYISFRSSQCTPGAAAGSGWRSQEGAQCLFLKKSFFISYCSPRIFFSILCKLTFPSPLRPNLCLSASSRSFLGRACRGTLRGRARPRWGNGASRGAWARWRRAATRGLRAGRCPRASCPGHPLPSLRLGEPAAFAGPVPGWGRRAPGWGPDRRLLTRRRESPESKAPLAHWWVTERSFCFSGEQAPRTISGSTGRNGRWDFLCWCVVRRWRDAALRPRRLLEEAQRMAAGCPRPPTAPETAPAWTLPQPGGWEKVRCRDNYNPHQNMEVPGGWAAAAHSAVRCGKDGCLSRIFLQLRRKLSKRFI